MKDDIPGDAHICCKHPSLEVINENPLAQVMGIFASVKRIEPFIIDSKIFNIELDPAGVKRGWANWPMNFDPIWLLNCDAFEPKEER